MSAGRPRKATADRHTYIFHLPLTEAERATLEAAAKWAGGTLAGWARMVLLAEARRQDRRDGQDGPQQT